MIAAYLHRVLDSIFTSRRKLRTALFIAVGEIERLKEKVRSLEEDRRILALIDVERRGSEDRDAFARRVVETLRGGR